MVKFVTAVLVLVASLAGFFALFGYFDSRPNSPRIALYGDSLAMESAQDFQFLANAAAAPVFLRAYGGTALCDILPHVRSDATSWRPNVAVLEFSGNASTPCMKGFEPGTPSYYAKYRRDALSAVDVFEKDGIKVLLMGAPVTASVSQGETVTRLNRMYADIAKANPDVEYFDAGKAVLANGRFTWTLPCLTFEPCAGSAGTNIVRSPDGVHFCPSGNTTIIGHYAECDVYSSGALRFAMAMLGPALGEGR